MRGTTYWHCSVKLRNRRLKKVLLLATFFLPLAARAQNDDFSRQYKRVINSVVTVYVCPKTTGLCTENAASVAGSGFYVGNNVFVTNHHVVGSSDSILLVTSDHHQIPGMFTWLDPKEDLAFISVDNLEVMALPMYEQGVLGSGLGFSGSAPEIGSRVYVIGSPALGDGNTLSPGSLSAGIVSNISPDAIQIDAAINPGNSGGPVLNSRGDVIGVAVAAYREGVGEKPDTKIALQGLNIAIPLDRVQEALNRYRSGSSNLVLH